DLCEGSRARAERFSAGRERTGRERVRRLARRLVGQEQCSFDRVAAPGLGERSNALVGDCLVPADLKDAGAAEFVGAGTGSVGITQDEAGGTIGPAAEKVQAPALGALADDQTAGHLVHADPL